MLTTHAVSGTAYQKLESHPVHSRATPLPLKPCWPSQRLRRDRETGGFVGAVCVGFLVFLRTGEVLSLKIRQVWFHDATATVSLVQADSKGPHRSGVAEFVRASDPIAMELPRRLTVERAPNAPVCGQTGKGLTLGVGHG